MEQVGSKNVSHRNLINLSHHVKCNLTFCICFQYKQMIYLVMRPPSSNEEISPYAGLRLHLCVCVFFPIASIRLNFLDGSCIVSLGDFLFFFVPHTTSIVFSDHDKRQITNKCNDNRCVFAPFSLERRLF